MSVTLPSAPGDTPSAPSSRRPLSVKRGKFSFDEEDLLASELLHPSSGTAGAASVSASMSASVSASVSAAASPAAAALPVKLTTDVSQPKPSPVPSARGSQLRRSFTFDDDECDVAAVTAVTSSRVDAAAPAAPRTPSVAAAVGGGVGAAGGDCGDVEVSQQVDAADPVAQLFSAFGVNFNGDDEECVEGGEEEYDDDYDDNAGCEDGGDDGSEGDNDACVRRVVDCHGDCDSEQGCDECGSDFPYGDELDTKRGAGASGVHGTDAVMTAAGSGGGVDSAAAFNPYPAGVYLDVDVDVDLDELQASVASPAVDAGSSSAPLLAAVPAVRARGPQLPAGAVAAPVKAALVEDAAPVVPLGRGMDYTSASAVACITIGRESWHHYRELMQMVKGECDYMGAIKEGRGSSRRHSISPEVRARVVGALAGGRRLHTVGDDVLDVGGSQLCGLSELADDDWHRQSQRWMRPVQASYRVTASLLMVRSDVASGAVRGVIGGGGVVGGRHLSASAAASSRRHSVATTFTASPPVAAAVPDDRRTGALQHHERERDEHAYGHRVQQRQQQEQGRGDARYDDYAYVSSRRSSVPAALDVDAATSRRRSRLAVVDTEPSWSQRDGAVSPSSADGAAADTEKRTSLRLLMSGSSAIGGDGGGSGASGGGRRGSRGGSSDGRADTHRRTRHHSARSSRQRSDDRRRGHGHGSSRSRSRHRSGSRSRGHRRHARSPSCSTCSESSRSVVSFSGSESDSAPSSWDDVTAEDSGDRRHRRHRSSSRSRSHGRHRSSSWSKHEHRRSDGHRDGGWERGRQRDGHRDHDWGRDRDGEQQYRERDHHRDRERDRDRDRDRDREREREREREYRDAARVASALLSPLQPVVMSAAVAPLAAARFPLHASSSVAPLAAAVVVPSFAASTSSPSAGAGAGGRAGAGAGVGTAVGTGMAMGVARAAALSRSAATAASSDCDSEGRRTPASGVESLQGTPVLSLQGTPVLSLQGTPVLSEPVRILRPRRSSGSAPHTLPSLPLACAAVLAAVDTAPPSPAGSAAGIVTPSAVTPLECSPAVSGASTPVPPGEPRAAMAPVAMTSTVSERSHSGVSLGSRTSSGVSVASTSTDSRLRLATVATVPFRGQPPSHSPSASSSGRVGSAGAAAAAASTDRASRSARPRSLLAPLATAPRTPGKESPRR
jgi:hypothetical protein